MKLELLLARARYLALVLPLFALMSTIHTGCTAGVRGSGLYGGSSGSSGSSSSCTSGSGPGAYGNYGGGVRYGSDCEDDAPGFGGGER